MRDRDKSVRLALRAEGLVKQFSGVPALDDVDLGVARGTVHALLGGNGSGKSTLIRALAGVSPADAGRVTVGNASYAASELSPRLARAHGLRFVHQQLSVFPELTVAENLAIGFGWRTGATGRIRWRAQRQNATQLLGRFGINARPGQPLGSCSVATQTMVCVARAMQDLDDAGLLVLDEPTSAFPPAQVDLLLGFVRSFVDQGHSVVYITHRLDEVVRVADQATVLRDGRVETRLDRDELSHARLTRVIMGPAGLSVASQWERVTSDAKPAVEVSGLAGGPVVETSFTLRPGEIVGLAGLLGSGRSSMLRLLFGDNMRSAGTVSVDGRAVGTTGPRSAMHAGVAYIPENRAKDAAFAELSVAENISMATSAEHFQRGRLRRRAESTAALKLMAEFRVKAPSVKAPLATLSGGNQQKVILARWLRRKPRLILLDEPSQGVDVGARAEIWQLIRQAVDDGACALVATSDLDEMATFCDRALVMRRGSVVEEVAAADMTEHTLQLRAFGLVEEAK